MIIFESSQKQEKKGQSRPPSGEHVYATVNKSGSGSPFVGSSGRKDDGLSTYLLVKFWIIFKFKYVLSVFNDTEFLK